MIKIEKVEGKDKGDIMLYALSTCVWCRRTKQLLKDLGVSFSYIYVDLLEEDDKDEIMEKIEKWNPRLSFPTIIFRKEKCITGFKEEEIKKELNK